MKYLLPIVTSVIWGNYVGQKVLSYIADHSVSSENPGILLVPLIVFLVVAPIVFFLTNKLVSNKVILLIIAVMPIILPVIFPVLSTRSMNTYYLNKAVTTNNEAYCYKMPRYQNDCLTKIALSKKSSDLCNQITTNEPSNETRYKCLLSVAEEEKNPKICEMIPVMNDYVWVTNMRNDCFSETAKKLSDISLCEKIQDTTKKFDCVATISPNDAALICSKKTFDPNDVAEFNGCYENLVQRYHGDSSICSMMKAWGTGPIYQGYLDEAIKKCESLK